MSIVCIFLHYAVYVTWQWPMALYHKQILLCYCCQWQKNGDTVWIV